MDVPTWPAVLMLVWIAWTVLGAAAIVALRPTTDKAGVLIYETIRMAIIAGILYAGGFWAVLSRV
jgi:hypothetical protein